MADTLMFEKLKSILSKVDSDYADLRYEVKKETSITFNGKELTQIGSNSTDGYVLRILKRGGLSSIAFTREEEAEWAIRTAQENALLMAGKIKKPVTFAEAEVVEESFSPDLDGDPGKVSMDEKLELTKKYNSLPLLHEGIAHTVTDYMEILREKHFLSSEGSRIREDLVTTRLSGLITSKDGTLIQNVRVGLGGSNGFAVLRNQEEEFEKKTSIALDLLKARPVEGGTYSVLLNPSMAGVFTHEAFGHFSEADLIEDAPSMREKMKIGSPLGNEVLSITDNPTMPGQLGFYRYDDEGARARRVELMKNGVLTGRLHSRRTAAAFGEPLSGHCVAEDYRYAPIIRMGSIYIEPGLFTFDDLLSKLGDGLYLLYHMGGQTSGENFTFGAQYGYQVKNGRLGRMIRDINLSGNLYHTLKNIYAVGNDLTLSKVGGCGKGQMNIRSCNGGPHILVKDVVIGGR
jgi:TldD protein